MPRRKPAVAVQTSDAASVHRLSAEDLDELLAQARVPQSKRADCARDINQQFDFYDDRLARRNAPSEASQAESLRLVVDAGRELYKALASLPPALRIAVEPDYQAYVRKGFAEHVARETAYAVAAKTLAKRDPSAQWLADETARLPRSVREDVPRFARHLLPRARAPLPLQLILTALIGTAEERRAEIEKQVSRSQSKRRATFWRNELARHLKAIGMVYSPTLAGDVREAEDWAASLLEFAEILYPKRETNAVAFNAMFGRRKPKPLP